jgi:large-conductance mechanosensitive channel
VLMARVKRGEEVPPPAAPTPEVLLLTEIRDALKNNNPKGGTAA